MIQTQVDKLVQLHMYNYRAQGSCVLEIFILQVDCTGLKHIILNLVEPSEQLLINSEKRPFCEDSHIFNAQAK